MKKASKNPQKTVRNAKTAKAATAKSATSAATKLPYKTAWDFSDLYASENDPEIEKDVEKIEAAYAKFAKKYAGTTTYTEDEAALLEAIEDFVELYKATASTKPVWYLHLLRDIDSENAVVTAKFDLLNNRIAKAINQIVFFEINLGKIPADKQKQFLSSARLKPFAYYLEKIFTAAKYNLSEAEEKVLNLTSQPAHSMWVDAQRKYLNSHTVKHKGKQIPMTQALAIKADLPLKERRALHLEIIKKCKEISFLATAELNAVVINKKISDELRGYKEPYEATVLSYLNDKKSIETLVDVVTKNFNISQRFYKLKAKMAKLPFLTNADIGVDIGSSKQKFPFEKGVELTSRAFNRAGSEFTYILHNMLKQGRIDVFPKKGKRNGAYCAGGPNVPTSIHMNYTDSHGSVMVLAHEMGHAIHTELSKKQPPLYEDYPTSIAEVASTFFENLIFQEVFETLPEKEKPYALFNRIQDDVSTIFRQIAFFNFELDLHTQIRQKGSLTNAEIADMYRKHLGSYLGSAVKLVEEDGHTFVYIPHFRYFFYVYSYAYGQIISKALYKKFKEDPTFIEKVKEFLSAGSSKSPAQIFLDIGIDTTKPEFFAQGLASIEEDINQLEKLAKKNKLI